jgi:hypothetical protein
MAKEECLDFAKALAITTFQPFHKCSSLIIVQAKYLIIQWDIDESDHHSHVITETM